MISELFLINSTRLARLLWSSATSRVLRGLQGNSWQFHRLSQFSVQSEVNFLKLDCCRGLAWMNARCPRTALYYSSSSARQGRKNIMTGLWVKIRTGRDYLPIIIMGKRDWTWGKILIYHQSNQSRIMRNKTKSYKKTHLPPVRLPSFCA